jgi:hypothetical protein
MARYIDASELMRRIGTEALRWGEEYDLSQIMGDIEDFPAADVVEVKHGKWEKPTLNLECFADGYVICSECNVMLPNITEIPEYYYCPYCGAKMDGGE